MLFPLRVCLLLLAGTVPRAQTIEDSGVVLAKYNGRLEQYAREQREKRQPPYDPKNDLDLQQFFKEVFPNSRAPSDEELLGTWEITVVHRIFGGVAHYPAGARNMDGSPAYQLRFFRRLSLAAPWHGELRVVIANVGRAGNTQGPVPVGVSAGFVYFGFENFFDEPDGALQRLPPALFTCRYLPAERRIACTQNRIAPPVELSRR